MVETIEVVGLVLTVADVEFEKVEVMVPLVPLVEPVVVALAGRVIVAGGRVMGLDDAEAHWLM